MPGTATVDRLRAVEAGEQNLLPDTRNGSPGLHLAGHACSLCSAASRHGAATFACVFVSASVTATGNWKSALILASV